MFAKDVTEQKRLRGEVERYKERLAAMQRGAYVDGIGTIIAHELNQPLTVINMQIAELLDEIGTGKQSRSSIVRALEQALAESRRASQIVSRVRQSSVQAFLHGTGQADVAQIAGSVMSVLSGRAKEAGLDITLDLAKSLPAVTCSRAGLEQIFVTLIDNAIDAAGGEEGHKLVIKAQSRDEGVQLEFRDDCCGIAKENIARIFEPFFTTKKGGKGLGLGLEIVQRILLSCGGRISVESEVGKGSAFLVFLPTAND
jgi:signal transduction histidine kinase